MKFNCKECKQLGKLVTCQVFKTANKEYKALDRYDVFEESWPLAEVHVCAPSGFNKMVVQCRKNVGTKCNICEKVWNMFIKVITISYNLTNLLC